MGVGTVSDIKILIFVMRGPFMVVALLPLTQNTLPSKDVREYVFSCFLMAYKSRDLPGVILNEFGINLDSIIFLIIFLKIVTSKVLTVRCQDACRDSGVGCPEQVLISKRGMRWIGGCRNGVGYQNSHFRHAWSLYGHDAFVFNSRYPTIQRCPGICFFMFCDGLEAQEFPRSDFK